jgi:hypothetical protein
MSPAVWPGSPQPDFIDASNLFMRSLRGLAQTPGNKPVASTLAVFCLYQRPSIKARNKKTPKNIPLRRNKLRKMR